MKKLIRNFLIEAGLLYLISQSISGLNFSNGLASILETALALTLAGFLVKPIINILLLPINLMTFGLFRWLANALTLYLVDLVLPEFSVTGFVFAGLTTELFAIPSFQTPSVLVSYILFSLTLSILGSVLYWLVK